jgi:hypothetical protein
MTTPGRDAVAEARERVIAAGEAFRAAVVPAVAAALRSRLDDLVASKPEWRASMDEDVRVAFRDATERAISQGAADVERRLTGDVWVEPLLAPGFDRSPPTAWEGDLPEWLISVIRSLSGRRRPEPVGDLDDVGNRAWIAVLAAAKPLDPVLEEFGLVPSDIPDLGGGNFGLAPRNAQDLDPNGSVRSRWNRYRAVYEEYRDLTRSGGRRTRRR